MIRYEDIQEKVESYHPSADLDLLRRAYIFSAREHRGQVRRSGEPYLVHPLEVAGILADLRLDLTCIVVGLLHDVVEDTLTTIEAIASTFGKDIAHIVEGVTKLSRFNFHSKEEQQAENLRKMLLAMVDDIRVILVKLADRLHNMRTLGFMPRGKQCEIARETQEIYAPIAHRLGIGRIKSELEDLSLKFIDPAGYESLRRQLELKRTLSEEFIQRIQRAIGDAVAAQGIEAEITGRLKSGYSIYQKMQRQNVGVDEIYDQVAFRLLVPTVKDCYGSLGLIHSMWSPVPGRFRDFIAMPKPNGYQSLHTSVMSRGGQTFEVQIRTHSMHQIAEVGIAAHWSYKEGGGEARSEDVDSVQWLRQYLDVLQDVQDPREFLNVARMNLYPDEVYAFTPRGDVKSFPRGATAVDFAYAVHTDIGHRCTGARINRKFVPLRTEMHNGDIVEILTSPTQHPSRDWLRFVRTSKARSKVRQWLNVHERRKSISLGRELAEREFRKFRFNPKRYPSAQLSQALKHLGFERYEDFLASVGYGKTAPGSLVASLDPTLRPQERHPSRLARVVRKALGVGRAQIEVEGVGDVMVTLARCCSPIPGEEIVGYVTRGRGVSVHGADCRNIQGLLYDSHRRIDVAWSRRRSGEFTHAVQVVVRVDDRQGVLARITSAISEEGTNIKTVEARVANRQGTIHLVLEISDTRHLERILKRLKEIDGIRDAVRHVG
ncbi:MAG: RelA/SpoT family protein [Acidobacteriota bacterium]